MTDPLLRFDVSPREALALQRSLAARVVDVDAFGEVRHVGGVDVAYDEATGMLRAAAVTLSFPDLIVVDEAVVERGTPFPYVPGLLSFRETPACADAVGRLAVQPDVILCDGAGRAHPRRFGIACHLGLVLDLPTIGVAKSWLLGRHAELPPWRGARVSLLDAGEVVGAVVRTRHRVRPLYVSVGHKVSLHTAVELVLACSPRYRLPETTRAADARSRGRPAPGT